MATQHPNPQGNWHAVRISRTYHYDSAHWLPNVPADHKCGSMHGHTYQLTVTLAGEPDGRGWIMDFAEIDNHVEPHLHLLDHHVINDQIPNPTLEQQLLWWRQHLASLPLAELHLKEGLSNAASLQMAVGE